MRLMTPRISQLALAACAILWLISPILQAKPVDAGHVTAELVPQNSALAPGEPFAIALKLTIDSGWHVNWINPGDAGLAPEIEWELPEGFTAGDIQWAYPHKLPLHPFMGFGYEEKILFPVVITPSNAISESSITIRAHAEWLVCREECVPEEANLEFTMSVDPAGATQPSAWHDEFTATYRDFPVTPTGWQFSTAIDDTSFLVTMTPPEGFIPSFSDVFLFPQEKGIIENALPQILTTDGETYQLLVQRNRMVHDNPEKFTVVLVADAPWLPNSDAKAITTVLSPGAELAPIAGTTTNSNSSVSSLWLALVLAFAGGLILNLMPCVLPVLSLKVFGIIHSAQQAKSTVIRHGLLFTLGVLLSFWILAGTLILLQAGGEQLGWGFQLQSPAFIVVLTSLLFVFGLNLLGVFEIGTSLTALGQKGEHSNGNLSSFFNGVLATIVATPCTAPFMGSALGYSLSQPPFVAMLIFTALGLGMAAPYLVISFVPNLAKLLPKPGAWMETLKQVMGFLLLATVIWLLYVLSQQIDSLAISLFLGCLLLLGIAGWILGRWGTLMTDNGPRKTAKIIATTIAIASVICGIYITGLAGPSSSLAHESEGVPLAWQPFSPSELERLRQANKPVFIDFTAAWCLSCKVNERIALYNDQVVAAFKERGITTMKADWTNRDATIAQTLAAYGRNSVPLYLYFNAGMAEPIVLPEILTPGIVLDALQETKEDIQYD